MGLATAVGDVTRTSIAKVQKVRTEGTHYPKVNDSVIVMIVIVVVVIIVIVTINMNYHCYCYCNECEQKQVDFRFLILSSFIIVSFDSTN